MVEIIEGEELSEVIEKVVLDDEESLKFKIFEDVFVLVLDNFVECVDLVVDLVIIVEFLEDLVVVGFVFIFNDVEDEFKYFEDVLELYLVVFLEIGDNEGVRVEFFGENLFENIDGDIVDDVGEEDKEVVEVIMSEDFIEENLEGVEIVFFDDIEMKVFDVNFEDLSEINVILESLDNVKERVEIIGEEIFVIVSIDVVDLYVEEGEEIVEVIIGKDLKEEVLVEVKIVLFFFDDVVDNFVEVNFEDFSEVVVEMFLKSIDCEDVGVKVFSEELVDVVDNELVEVFGEEVVEVVFSVEFMVELLSLILVFVFFDEVGVKDVEVNYEEVVFSVEFIVELLSLEVVCVFFDDVEVKDVEVNFEVVSGMIIMLEIVDCEYVRFGIFV